MTNLISLIVPIYKVEKYLSYCIESIIKQTYPNIEVILVDDGSPDNCGKICDEYAKKDERIIVIHKENGGLSDARNAGLKLAKGQYVSFIDSDDMVHKGMVEMLLKVIKKFDADVAVCDYITVDEKSEYCDSSEANSEELCLNNEEFLHCTYLNKKHGMEFVAWGKLYNINLFKDNNIEYPVGKLHEDTYTTYKLLYYAKKIAFCGEPMYYYRIRNGSIMTSKFDNRRLTIIDATKEACDFFVLQNSSIMNDAIKFHFKTMLMLYVNVQDPEMREIILRRLRTDCKLYLNHFRLFDINRLYYQMMSAFPLAWVIRLRYKL